MSRRLKVVAFFRIRLEWKYSHEGATNQPLYGSSTKKLNKLLQRKGYHDMRRGAFLSEFHRRSNGTNPDRILRSTVGSEVWSINKWKIEINHVEKFKYLGEYSDEKGLERRRWDSKKNISKRTKREWDIPWLRLWCAMKVGTLNTDLKRKLLAVEMVYMRRSSRTSWLQSKRREDTR